MENMFESIGITIINVLEILGIASIELIKNPMFQIIIGIVILYIVINITMGMVKEMRKRKQVRALYNKYSSKGSSGSWSYAEKRKHLGMKD